MNNKLELECRASEHWHTSQLDPKTEQNPCEHLQKGVSHALSHTQDSWRVLIHCFGQD